MVRANVSRNVIDNAQGTLRSPATGAQFLRIGNCVTSLGIARWTVRIQSFRKIRKMDSSLSALCYFCPAPFCFFVVLCALLPGARWPARPCLNPSTKQPSFGRPGEAQPGGGRRRLAAPRHWGPSCEHRTIIPRRTPVMVPPRTSTFFARSIALKAGCQPFRTLGVSVWCAVLDLVMGSPDSYLPWIHL